MWSYLTHDMPINPIYRNILIAVVLMFLEESVQGKECWTPVSTHTNVPIYTPALAIQQNYSCFPLLFPRKGQGKRVKPKHKYVEDVFYYNQKHLNMLGNNIIHYTNLL